MTYSCRWLLRKNKVNVSIVRESMLSFSTVPLFSVCVGGGEGGVASLKERIGSM